MSELKATVEIGLAHRDGILKNIACEYEQWNNLVSLYYKQCSLLVRFLSCKIEVRAI